MRYVIELLSLVFVGTCWRALRGIYKGDSSESKSESEKAKLASENEPAPKGGKDSGDKS
jgi:hypothetical protein